MRFHFAAISSNRKVGPLPVVTASADTCPDSCGLKGAGCYAEGGHVGMFWKKLSTGKIPGIDFKELLKKIRALPRHQLWRYAQAGDLPPDREDVLELAKANQGRQAIAYTHGRDFETYKEAAKLGFNINISTDSPEEADEMMQHGLPVVTVLPSFYEREKGEDLRDYRERLGGSLSLQTPQGNRIAICPATYMDDVTCSTCGVCASPRAGNAIVGFPSHGVRKKAIDVRLNEEASRVVRYQKLRKEKDIAQWTTNSDKSTNSYLTSESISP